MPLDHACVTASTEKYEAVCEWYLKALKPLGYEKKMDFPGQAIGIGDPHPDFWVGGKEGASDNTQLHFAFRCKTREQVRKFHEAALAAGGKCNGPPGIRTMYHPNYYGAFVFDPIGNNIEAVCHLDAKEAGE